MHIPRGHFIRQMVFLGMGSGRSAEIKFFGLQRLLVPRTDRTETVLTKSLENFEELVLGRRQ